MTKKPKKESDEEVWLKAQQECLEQLGYGSDEIPPICFLAREIMKLQKRISELEAKP